MLGTAITNKISAAVSTAKILFIPPQPFFSGTEEHTFPPPRYATGE
jgi:hypothetical protein